MNDNRIFDKATFFPSAGHTAVHVFESRPSSHKSKTNKESTMFMNSNLFEPGKSKAEKNFIQQAVKQNHRLDGRRSNECRDVHLTFGADWGTVAVSLGETKVMAQVSSDIGVPTTARANEGKLQLNVNIGGVAFLDESQSTHDQRFLTLNSLLERTFRSSRCLDLESLCVAAEQHVWCVRVDINVLNHDGNLYGKLAARQRSSRGLNGWITVFPLQMLAP